MGYPQLHHNTLYKYNTTYITQFCIITTVYVIAFLLINTLYHFPTTGILLKPNIPMGK